MHVRETKVRRGAKTYRYLQLVRSYRRPDGMPAHEVLLTLPYRSEVQATNLRNFAKADRDDVELALVDAESGTMRIPDRPVLANLRYLDLAVLRRIWRDSGLHDLLRSVLPSGAEDVANADVLEALILHRCVDPGSKLSAVRWFPRTALPELTGISPTQFNNSRLHRALEALDAAEGALQSRLAPHLQAKEGRFVALFMDGTDTWFEGEGPDLAARGRTKEGTFREKIVIVALCDQRGLPLRWSVLSGACSEVRGMGELWEELGRCSWVGSAPIVADRAMGAASIVDRLAAAGPRFLVAVREPEFRAWVPNLAGLPTADFKNASALADHLRGQNFTRIDDRTWFRDAGIVPAERPSIVDSSDAPPSLADTLRVARELREGGGSLAAIAKRTGYSKTNVRKYLSLLTLPVDLIDRVDAGEAEGLSFGALVEIANTADHSACRAAFEAALKRPKHPNSRPRRNRTTAVPSTTQVRGVVYFNPEMFDEQRRGAAAQLREMSDAIDALNRQAVGSPKRYPAKTLISRAGRELARRNLIDVYDVEVSEQGGVSQVVLRRDDAEWARRRAFDGFSLLLAHRDLDVPGPELIQLYRDKNAIEMDFRTVKSVLDLRPIFHFTDAKVRAHVSLCVLALVLCRLVEQRLSAIGLTASAAIETLATCHVNQLVTDPRGHLTYTVTRTNPEQTRILNALHLGQLAEDDAVRSAITPR